MHTNIEYDYVHTHAHIDSNLDLPFLLNATIIAQRDGCYSEDTQPERNAITDTIREVLQAALLRLGLLPVG